MFSAVRKFIKAEPVLSVAAVLAVVSMFLVPPCAAYLKYPDYRTLSLLFCLMAVVAGWQKAGVFRHLGVALLKRMKHTRQLVQVLTFLCFFSSMLITNDVSLITFVPLSVLVLQGERKPLLIRTVVLQTIAANAGSMLLPIGNPQNLYLYGLSGLSLIGFIRLVLPVWLVALAALFAATMLTGKQPVSVEESISGQPDRDDRGGRRGAGAFYTVLFCLCLATVIGVLPYYILLPVMLAAILVFDRKLLWDIDYMLLLTFVCFFVFIGNMKAIPAIADLLEEVLSGREFAVSLIASQVISNVPAAILLSGFTGNIRMLVLGTDIGGLGTLIASLASLISFNLYRKAKDADGKRYFLVFTGANVVFLAVLIMAAAVLC